MGRAFSVSEPWIFRFIIFLHCLPVLLLPYFVTHDGPAHVYNSILINKIFSQHNGIISDFYLLRSLPEPNWIGHAMMAIMCNFISGVHAEKILLILFIVLLPLSFRRLLQTINPGSQAFSYFVFPFVYSYAFYGGLYNFMLGIPLVLWGCSFLLNKKEYKSRDYFVLFFLSMLLYFSHLIVFGIFLLLLFTDLVIKYVDERKRNSEKRIQWRHILFLTAALLPGLILCGRFLAGKLSGHPETVSNATSKPLHDLLVVSPTLALDSNETKYGIMTVLVFVLILVLVVFKKLRTRNTDPTGQVSSGNIFMLFTCLLMLLCYFIIPEDFATGGVVKVRFSYFFFFFLTCWLASIADAGRIIWKAAGFILVISLIKLNYFYGVSKRMSDDAEVMLSVAPFIDTNSIVLPLCYSDNWMHGNLSNYLGAETDILVLDNYEAGREHFPLAWKDGMNPVNLLGKFNGSVPLCADIASFEKLTGKNIDYIVRWKYQEELTDSCTAQIESVIAANYTLAFRSFDKQLYLYKRL